MVIFHNFFYVYRRVIRWQFNDFPSAGCKHMGASYLAAQDKTPFRPVRLAHSSTGETQLVSVRGGVF